MYFFNADNVDGAQHEKQILQLSQLVASDTIKCLARGRQTDTCKKSREIVCLRRWTALDSAGKSADI